MANKININNLKTYLNLVLYDQSPSEKTVDKTLIVGTLASYLAGGMLGGLAFTTGYQWHKYRSITASSSPLQAPVTAQNEAQSPIEQQTLQEEASQISDGPVKQETAEPTPAIVAPETVIISEPVPQIDTRPEKAAAESDAPHSTPVSSDSSSVASNAKNDLPLSTVPESVAASQTIPQSHEMIPSPTPIPSVPVPAAPPQEPVLPQTNVATQNKTSTVASTTGLTQSDRLEKKEEKRATVDSIKGALTQAEYNEGLAIALLLGGHPSQRKSQIGIGVASSNSSSSVSKAAERNPAVPVKRRSDAPVQKSNRWWSRFFTLTPREAPPPPNLPGRPPGIPNAGNSCFAASALHLMMAYRPFAEALPNLIRPPIEPDLVLPPNKKDPFYQQNPAQFIQDKKAFAEYQRKRTQYEQDIKTYEHNKELLANTVATYTQERDSGVYRSSINIQGFRALMPYSINNGGIYSQQDASELFQGIANSISINLDDNRTVRKQQFEQFREHVNHPLVHTKMVLNVVEVPENAPLEGTLLERLNPKNPAIATSQKFSIESPIITLRVERDPKTKKYLTLPELLQKKFFHEVAEKGTGPYKLPNAGGKSGRLQYQENHFDRIPKFLIMNLVRQEVTQKMGVAETTLMIDGKPVKIKEEIPLSTTARAVTDPIEAPSALFWPSSPEEPAEFELQGFIRHMGGTGGGHYVAYIKDKEKYWYLNDSRVVSITAEEFANNKNYSYVVLYTPKSAKPLK